MSPVLALAALCGLGPRAYAQNAAAQLPSLALTPPPPALTAKALSRWHGYDFGRLKPYTASGPGFAKTNAASRPSGPNALSNLQNAPANAKIPGTDINVSAHMSLNMGIGTRLGQGSAPR
ncbi:MAG: hypothetical protein ACYC5H_10060 [Methylovirgula sp.]